MKSIKTSISAKLVALLFGAALFGLVSQSALAVGTQSGTSISNTATLNYTVATVAQAAITSTAASFTVDDKVNVLVAGGVITPETPGATSVVTPFTVTNNGNATQGYNLVAANAASGAYTVNATAITDNFDPAVALTIYLDNNGNGIVDGADAVVTTIPTLAPNATVNLLVMTDIPLAQVNTDGAVVSLRATTVWPTPLVAAEEPAAVVAGAVVTATAGANTAGVDVVLADGAGVIDNASDGAYSTYGAFKVATAVLSVSKVATLLCDPINGNVNPKNIPGAAVQYAVTITNASGGASATLTTVTDTLVAALGFDPKLINGVGAGTLCNSATGTSLSASGFGAVYGTGTTTTTYASPGLAGQAVTAGAAVAAGTATITYGSLVGGGLAGFVGGVLPANSYITVYFNAFVQ
jgi:hypothetical protein